MQNSDIAYIKGMLWGIVGGVIYEDSGVLDPIHWLIFLNILIYSLEFIFYRLEENGE